MIKQIKQKIVGMLTEGERPKPPYRLGVALSGGGARGFAHVGALKALEEAGMKPDVIAGVSAGAVAAVMYAAGVPTTRCSHCLLRQNSRISPVRRSFMEMACSVSCGSNSLLKRRPE